MNAMRYFTLILAMFFGVFLSAAVVAHDAFSGNTEARLAEDGGLTLEINLASVTVESFVSHISDRDNQVSAGNLHNIDGHLRQRAKDFYTLTVGERTLAAGKVDIEIIDIEDAVIFRVHYPGPLEGTVGFANEFILDTNPEFKSTLTVLNVHDVQLGLYIQTVDRRFDEVLLSNGSRRPNMRKVITQFLSLGVHHIALGYDHLLFLVGLLVVCRTWRSAISIVTFFTLAHSLTLSIAALDFIRISSVWVESAIALSIIYVGVENLWTAHQPRFRWLLTSLFGLVHGLGFASVLRDIGLGSDGAPILLPLLSFNLGVELGQVVLTAIFLPIIWRLRKVKNLEKYLLPGISALTILMGAYWFIVRIAGLG